MNNRRIVEITGLAYWYQQDMYQGMMFEVYPHDTFPHQLMVPDSEYNKLSVQRMLDHDPHVKQHMLIHFFR